MEGQNNRLMGRGKGAFLYVTLYVTLSNFGASSEAGKTSNSHVSFCSLLFRFYFVFEISHVTFTSPGGILPSEERTSTPPYIIRLLIINLFTGPAASKVVTSCGSEIQFVDSSGAC
jgi:hypothetical protein